MAVNNSARVTGFVLRTSERSGVSQDSVTADGTKRPGRAWQIRNALVMMDNVGVADVQLANDVRAPAVGDLVDYIVEVTAYRGEGALQAVGPYPA